MLKVIKNLSSTFTSTVTWRDYRLYNLQIFTVTQIKPEVSDSDTYFKKDWQKHLQIEM